MLKVSIEKFIEEWKSSSKLLCPKLRYVYDYWLYPIPEDPCKSGDCKCYACHNYKRNFEESDRLMVPEKPLPNLKKEV